MKNRISKNFHVPLNSLSNVKTAESSLARGHIGGGGGGLGVPRVGTRDPRHRLGGPYTRKKFFRTQVQIHTAATIRKEIVTPPPHSPKKGLGAGGYGGQNPKSHWGIIFGPKMMILQGG